MKRFSIIALSLVLTLSLLASCGDNSASEPGEDYFTLFADFSSGSTMIEPQTKDIPLPQRNEMPSSNALIAFFLADSLSEWTGLDFTLNDVIFEEEDSITVDWSAESTLIANLDGREQKKEFFFYDEDSLRWFMMDSMYRTLIENFGTDRIFYTMDGGKELAFDTLYPESVFPHDFAYMGSAFYFAHTGEHGDINDGNIPEWWGEYKCDDMNFSIGITNFNGQSFLFGFYNLRNGELFYDGTAGVYSDDGLMAEYGEISFTLSEDFEVIDIYVPESSEWSHLSGRYERIDN